MSFTAVAELSPVELKDATVYAEGWQSWSPIRLYRAGESSERALDEGTQTITFRPGKPVPEGVIQGEGLLIVAPEDGEARAWFAPEHGREVATLRLRDAEVAADGAVEEIRAPDLGRALSAVAVRLRAPRLVTIPTGWSTWSCYFDRVTEQDVLENAKAARHLGLPVEIFQLDHGYETAVGDWLDLHPTFGSLPRLADRLLEAGFRPGIWTAPFMVDPNSRLATAHPDWLVREADAGLHWGRRMRILDISQPAAAQHLINVFRTFADWGFSYHKIDFLYAGAMPGLAAYREGMRLIRDAVGPDAIVLACGAPLLPSIGLCDAMRVGPDVLPEVPDPQPNLNAVVGITRLRSWMNGRLWVNDPDHLVARPQINAREAWSSHLMAYGGVAFASDRFADLDARGLELTREFFSSRPSAAASGSEPGTNI